MMGSRILVIEDNPINLELIVYILRAWGHEPLCAADGESGLALAWQERPDLVLCDIQLPGIDGLEVARRLRADPRSAAIPLVALSALAMAEDVAASLGAGFDAHHSKPIDPKPFMAAMAGFLDGHARHPVAAPGEPDVADGRVPDELRARRQPCTLLLVDDWPLNLEFKREAFEAAGYTLHEASSLGQARQLLEHLRPDLLISDMCLPDGTGLDLLALWRSRPELAAKPFVILSSTVTDSATRQRALAMGAAEYLTRPIEPLRLLAAIRALV